MSTPTVRVDEAPPSALSSCVAVLQQRAQRLNAPAATPTTTEERLLAALLAGGRPAWEVVGDLVAGDFEIADHRALFAAIAGHLVRHLPLDPASLYTEFQAVLGRAHTQVIFRDVIARWQNAKPADAPVVVAELAPRIKQAARERETKRSADPTIVSAAEARDRWGDPRSWSAPARPVPDPARRLDGRPAFEVVEKQR